MAVIIFNINGYPVNSSKEENDLKIHRGDLEQIKADGRLKTISDDDYNSYITREKTARLDGENVVFEDVPNPAPENHSSSDFDTMLQMHQDILQKMLLNKYSDLKKAENAGLKTRLEGLQTGLKNADKSSITFPLTTSFARYWIDNESSEMFDIQFIS